MESSLLSPTGIRNLLSPDQSSACINWKDGETVITAVSLTDASNVIIANNNNVNFPRV